MMNPETLCRQTLVELGQLILDARNEAGMTQAEADDRLQVSHGYMSTLETNRKNAIPTVESITRVAKVVSADVDQAVTLVLRARLFRALAKTNGKFTASQVAAAAQPLVEG